MSKKRMKVKKLTLETRSGKEIELSLAEARDLYNELNELFGANYIPSTPVYIYPDRYTYPSQPYYISGTGTGTSTTLTSCAASSGLLMNYHGLYELQTASATS